MSLVEVAARTSKINSAAHADQPRNQAATAAATAAAGYYDCPASPIGTSEMPVGRTCRYDGTGRQTQRHESMRSAFKTNCVLRTSHVWLVAGLEAADFRSLVPSPWHPLKNPDKELAQRALLTLLGPPFLKCGPGRNEAAGPP
ncbi:unnamed protein product [Prorocentrum cordatum]|uniref:Uncharacterized protein n=1 Tax=Prorocentrum cordatum TaxID=2364126 RepID=A0ABN9PJ41_9DINO|nr:unnamed protein product [Polarella glacialis]